MDEWRPHRCFGLLLVLTLVAGFLASPELQARVDVLDHVEFTPVQTGTEIRIFLQVPMRYETHMPRQAGDTLQIELRNLTTSLALSPETEGRQILTPPPSERVPLSEVWYEFEPPESPRLILRFKRRVKFSARSAPDFRSIIVTVQGRPERPKTEADEQQPRPAPTPTAPAPQVPKSTPTSRRETEPVTVTHSPPSGERPAPSASAVNLDLPYAINLQSTETPIRFSRTLNLGTGAQYVVYSTTATVDGRRWYRLRVGFFAGKAQATAARNLLAHRYPAAWVAKVTREERVAAVEQSGAVALSPRPAPSTPGQPKTARTTGPSAPPAPVADLPAISDERLKETMEDAHQAMTAGNYRRAVQLYNKVLQYPDHAYAQDALEFLGLARDRNGQLAHAKAEYARYLELYPEGEGAERVHQRLQGLATARTQPREKLRKAKGRKEDAEWVVFGGWSQFYRRDWSQIDPADETTVDQSSLDSNLDITARRISARHDVRARLTAGYLHNFLDDGPDNDTRVNAAYIDAAEKRWKVTSRLGRQSRNTGGVLGRFDGGLLSYRVTPRVQLNGVAGYPVLSTTDGIETDRHFYGVSLDLGTFAKAWDFIPYFIDQQVDGITDRRAVGVEVRYFHPSRSLLGLLDYDIHFEDVNTALFLGNWTIPDWVTFTATADYRKTPVLTTTNALQGQPVESIDDLQTLFSNAEIKELAEDRTSSSRTFTVGLSRPLSAKLQLTGDVTMTRLSGTPSSGGVEGTDSTGNEFFYSAQLIGNSLIKQGDITILGVRYADASRADIISFNLDTRYPVNRAWRLNPKFRVSYRENDDGTDQITLSPAFRSTYVWRRRMTLELDAGAEFSTRDLVEDTSDSEAYFLSAGYRWDF